MPLDFPAAPTINDTYTYGGRTWTWDGTSWVPGVELYQDRGYYKGNYGTIGDPLNAANLFRINDNFQNTNITIASGENALACGPITLDPGVTLTVDTGGRVVIA